MEKNTRRFSDTAEYKKILTGREAKQKKYAAKAKAMWDLMDDNQRTDVRFGIFPQEAMVEAGAQGFDPHMVCVALMDVASANGGMGGTPCAR